MHRFLLFLILLVLTPQVSGAIQLVDYKGGFTLKKPLDVAIDDDGRIYAVDEEGVVYVETREGERISSWGPADKFGAWKIKKPGGIAVYGDKVYVTDAGAGRLLIFSKTGEYIESFQTLGSSSEMTHLPLGVFVFGGVIYVADASGRVQIFGPNGTFLGSIGDSGDPVTGLRRPVDVAVDDRGYIHVADAKNKSVQIYHLSGKHYWNIALGKEPSAIATDIDGFYVADEGYKIEKFSVGGEFEFAFGTPGKGKGQFQAISGLAVGKNGMVVASDMENNNIQFYVPERKKFIAPEKSPPITAVKRIYDTIIEGVADIFWGGSDDRLYGVDRKSKSIVVFKVDQVVKTLSVEDADPVAVAKDGRGYLWVLDGKRDSLVKLDTNGNVQLRVGTSGSKEGQFSGATDIAVSGRDFIFVADRGNGRVQIFNNEGIYLASLGKAGARTFLGSPVSVALDAGDNVYVLDEELFAVVKFSADGKHLGGFGKNGRGPGDFIEPCAILVANGEVFVLDKGTSNIKVFGLNGKFRRLFGSDGKGAAGFRNPTSLTIKDNTELFVSDTGNDRIQALGLIYTLGAPPALIVKSGMRNIDLSWPEPEAELKGVFKRFEVYRSDNPVTNFKKIASALTGSYSDNSVKPDRPYYYSVSVIAKDGNESQRTQSVEGRAAKFSTLPPIGLVAEPLDVEVTLRWQPNHESFVTSYAVYRKELGNFKRLGTVDTPSFTDKGLRPGRKYTYRVTSISSDNVESEATEIKIRTLSKKPSKGGIMNAIGDAIIPVIEAPGKAIKTIKKSITKPEPESAPEAPHE